MQIFSFPLGLFMYWMIKSMNKGKNKMKIVCICNENISGERFPSEMTIFYVFMYLWNYPTKWQNAIL